MSVEEQVTESLFNFLQSHVENLKIEDIDDIVLSYVVSILQDLTSGSYMDEDSFDVDAFCETIFAYMPTTECITPEEFTEWMFSLAKDQREKAKAGNKIQLDLKSVIEETANKGRKVSESGSLGSNTGEIDTEKKQQQQRNSARVSESGSDYSDLDNEDYKQLMEAFPGACALEVSHCLTLMSGDMEGAAQLILHRQESGQSLQPNDLKSRCLGGGGGVISKNGRKFKEVDDKSVKNRIMNSYGFVDQAEDMRYHRPTLKREDDKKMIRYRDGKIVSTKGERYTQVTKAESEEMKKSIVNNS